MPIVNAIIEVSRKNYKDTNPALHPDWFEGISLNGAKITDTHVSQGERPMRVHLKKQMDEHWQNRDTSQGIDIYSEILICFDSFEEAQEAFSTGQQWEIQSNVFLFLHGMRANPVTQYKDVQAVESTQTLLAS